MEEPHNPAMYDRRAGPEVRWELNGGVVTGSIEFFRREIVSRLGDPRRADEQVSITLEIRRDPLTGRSARLAHFGAISAQQLDFDLYRRPEVIGHCPFCGPERERQTPSFPRDLVPEGRLHRGQALLVPNLFPYDVHSTVCILTREHVVPLLELSHEIVADGFSLGLELWRRLDRAAPFSPAYPFMGWNYMPPSGGGLVHPHHQYFLMPAPGNRHREELEASAAFAVANDRDYWSTLIAREAELGERFIGATGPWAWLAAFAPEGVLGEILAVLPGGWNLDGFDEGAVAELTDGLLRCFRYFDAAGIHSFNAALFLGPRGQSHFATHLRLVPRTFLNLRDMAPDVNFLKMLLDEPVSVLRPEEMARELQPFFED